MIAFLIGFLVVAGVLYLGYLLLSLIWEAIMTML